MTDRKRWTSRAALAFVWARLLVEIPRQVDLRVGPGRAALPKRLDALEDYFDSDPEIPLLQRREASEVSCEIVELAGDAAWACMALRITRRAVAPEGHRYEEASVEFALTRDGEVKVHQMNLPGTPPPAFVDPPQQVSEAKAVAIELVATAIRLLDEATL
ncbi:MAG TPA: hypothetical protein VGI39_05025 [Polyangiaceae bacterium]|jgi:hypothetical protein